MSPFELIHVTIKILAGMKTMDYGRATHEFITLRARTQVGNRSYIYHTKQYPHPQVVSSPLWNVPQKLQAHADHVIKIRFHQLKGLTSTKNKGFNSKHMREIKYAEEKWILHRNAEPHRVNFKSIFSLSGTLVFKKRRRTTNRISNLFTYKSATRPSVTQTKTLLSGIAHIKKETQKKEKAMTSTPKDLNNLA